MKCTVIVPIAALWIIAGCSASTAPELHDLAQARERWAASNIHSYEYVGSVSCECLPETRRPVTVTVTTGVVTRRVYSDSGEPVAPTAAAFTTVEALFAIVDAASARHADLVDASYDPVSGVPLRISLDGSFQTADDEIGYYVSAFRSH